MANRRLALLYVLAVSLLIESHALTGAETKGSGAASGIKLEPLAIPAYQLPKLELLAPSQPDKYYDTASFSVAGKVTPPVATQAQVYVYHVRDDGGLVSQFSMRLPLDARGQFHISVNAPSARWKPGKSRVLVRLDGLPQVKSQSDFDVVANQQGPREFVYYEPPMSDVVIEVDKPATLDQTIPPGSLFLVRGRFHAQSGPMNNQGPGVRYKLVRPAQVGGGPEVIYQTGSSPSFSDGKNRSWFELLIDAPKQVGTYRLNLQLLGLAQQDEQRNAEQFKSELNLTVGAP